MSRRKGRGQIQVRGAPPAAVLRDSGAGRAEMAGSDPEWWRIRLQSRRQARPCHRA